MAGAKSPSYYQPHEVRTEEYRIARPMAAANDRVGCVGGQVIGLVLYPRVLLDRCACRSRIVQFRCQPHTPGRTNDRVKVTPETGEPEAKRSDDPAGAIMCGADERPMRFQLGDREYVVEEVVDQWYGPDASFLRSGRMLATCTS
jgi:hypothetical protein